MDTLMGVIQILSVVLFYVIPFVAIWFIARGGHAIRVFTFIASIIAVAIIAFRTGFSTHERAVSTQFECEFERPFRDLSEHFHDLLTTGQVDQAIVVSERMMELELRFSNKSGETNTLNDFVYSIENK